MIQARTLAAPRDTERAAPTTTATGTQATKRLEKAHCASHDTAGPYETPAPTTKAGILWELETQGGQH